MGEVNSKFCFSEASVKNDIRLDPRVEGEMQKLAVALATVMVGVGAIVVVSSTVNARRAEKQRLRRLSFDTKEKAVRMLERKIDGIVDGANSASVVGVVDSVLSTLPVNLTKKQKEEVRKQVLWTYGSNT